MALPLSLENSAETGRIRDYVVTGDRSHCDDRSLPSITRSGAHLRAWRKKAANRRTRRLAPTLTQALEVTTWLNQLDAVDRTEAMLLTGLDDLDAHGEAPLTSWHSDADDPAAALDQDDSDSVPVAVPAADTLDLEDLLSGGFSYTLDAALRGQLRRHAAAILAEQA